MKTTVEVNAIEFAAGYLEGAIISAQMEAHLRPYILQLQNMIASSLKPAEWDEVIARFHHEDFFDPKDDKGLLEKLRTLRAASFEDSSVTGKKA